MNERHSKILAAVIGEYTKTGLPVGSSVLVDVYGLDVSGATVRGDMVVLEQAGMLYQPHTSAGRIPTDVGYRYFVEEIMADRELSKREQQSLQRELLKLKAQNIRLMRTTAKLLSTVSGYAAVIVNAQTGESAEFGLRNLMAQVDAENIDDLCRIAETLDYIDEKCDTLMEELDSDETQIFIGAENPISKAKNYSMVVSRYEQNGEAGIIALIGPKNMKYNKNKSLINYVKKLLGGSVGLVVLMVL